MSTAVILAGKEPSLETLRQQQFPQNICGWLILRQLGASFRLDYQGLSKEMTLAKLSEVMVMVEASGVLPVQAGRLLIVDTELRLMAQHGVTLEPERFADFNQGPGSWTRLLVLGGGRGIDLIELFSRASALLAAKGEIVLIGEFIHQRGVREEEGLHRRGDVLALAERCDFELCGQQDLGPGVALTINHLIEVLLQSKADMQWQLGVESMQIDSFVQFGLSERLRYESGRSGYELMRFRRREQAVLSIGWISENQFEQVKSLFKHLFDKTLTRELWNWKYGAGQGRAVGVWRSGELIAHYGGLSRRILFRGRACLASQSVDVMGLPNGKNSLTRRPPFFLAAASYLESAVGYGRRHLLGVGFPSVRARRAAELLGLYGGPVGKMLELCWYGNRRMFYSRWLGFKELDLARSFDCAVIDRSWRAMRAALQDSILGIRDSDWVRYRFAEHPEYHYRFFSVYLLLPRFLLGVIVMHPHSDGRCEMMDIIGAPRSFKWLIAAGLRVARHLGADQLFAWMSDAYVGYCGHPDRVNDLGIGIPSNIWTPGPCEQELSNRWFLMAGDTDFR